MSLDTNPQPESDDLLQMESPEGEYEVITSEEVDRILDGLDQLIAGVTSENIRCLLEEAADSIYALVYSEEDADLGEQEEAA